MKKGSHHTTEANAKNSASHIGKYIGDKHPMWGRHHTPETLTKLCASWTPERRAKQCGDNHYTKRLEVRAKFAGENNPAKRPEVRAKISVAKLGRKRPDMVGDKNPAKRPEVRIKISDNNSMKRPEVRIKHFAAVPRGASNSAWRGGISREPYSWEFNDELKEAVRKRDDYQCQFCGAPQIECGRSLDIHHVDYNKKNSDPVNLVTLCRGCNVRANTNRKYWTAFFQKQAIARQEV